ncbi:class I SAM-dependent methyltransferase [Pseudozobellia thermophila]|uniref:Methyltransferase domain-containing protein n=1 Tax=Pseudozobellia thermophila TaxID=192903 RepID=A0A1M6M9X9_9FLAO|nr:class I SAM-dependent methyltransferase [Pseudozobellia thermophila]SHJ80267.1 Methyltransferase domain-containing protein [Pseudozobellia thermophila]
MKDIFGMALQDYQGGRYSEDITTSSSLDEEDCIPLPYLFRSYGDMPKLEQRALELCRGEVLDIGAGAGSHSLYLQGKGLKVTALDTSAGAIATCSKRGVEETVHSALLDYRGRTFDTLLMLMNGIGIVGRLSHMHDYLLHFKTLLKPGGQILLDSSDIIYMFEEDDDGGVWVPNTGAYYGEVEFTMAYKGQKSDSFFWLYVDYRTLSNAAMAVGLQCELVQEGKHYDYLARLWCA